MTHHFMYIKQEDEARMRCMMNKLAHRTKMLRKNKCIFCRKTHKRKNLPSKDIENQEF